MPYIAYEDGAGCWVRRSEETLAEPVQNAVPVVAAIDLERHRLPIACKSREDLLRDRPEGNIRRCAGGQVAGPRAVASIFLVDVAGTHDALSHSPTGMLDVDHTSLGPGEQDAYAESPEIAASYIVGDAAGNQCICSVLIELHRVHVLSPNLVAAGNRCESNPRFPGRYRAAKGEFQLRNYAGRC